MYIPVSQTKNSQCSKSTTESNATVCWHSTANGVEYHLQSSNTILLTLVPNKVFSQNTDAFTLAEPSVNSASTGVIVDVEPLPEDKLVTVKLDCTVAANVASDLELILILPPATMAVKFAVNVASALSVPATMPSVLAKVLVKAVLMVELTPLPDTMILPPALTVGMLYKQLAFSGTNTTSPSTYPDCHFTPLNLHSCEPVITV